MADQQYIFRNAYGISAPIGSSILSSPSLLTDHWTPVASSVTFTVSGKTARGGAGHLGDIFGKPYSRGGTGVIGSLIHSLADSNSSTYTRVFFKNIEVDSTPIASSVLSSPSLLTDHWTPVASSVTYTVSGKTGRGGAGHLGDIFGKPYSRGGTGVIGSLNFKANELSQVATLGVLTTSTIICQATIVSLAAVIVEVSSSIVAQAAVSAVRRDVIGHCSANIVAHALVNATSIAFVFSTSTIVAHAAVTAFPIQQVFASAAIVCQALIGPGIAFQPLGAVRLRDFRNRTADIVCQAVIVAFDGISAKGIINGCYPYIMTDHWQPVSPAVKLGFQTGRGGAGHLGDILSGSLTDSWTPVSSSVTYSFANPQTARGGAGHLGELRPPSCTPACIINCVRFRTIFPVIDIVATCVIFAGPQSIELCRSTITCHAQVVCNQLVERFSTAEIIASAGLTVRYALAVDYPFPINIVCQAVVTIAESGIDFPPPIITDVIPDAVSFNSPDTTITIIGLYFDPTCIAQWVMSPPVPLSTVFISDTELTAVIPHSLLGNVGTALIYVYKEINYPLDSGIQSSNGYPFRILAPVTSGSIVRVGDHSTGQGNFPPATAISGSSNVNTNSKATVRVGDSWSVVSDGMTSHGATSVQGSPTIFVNGQPVVRVGDALSDGDHTAEGSPNVIGD